ncbi:MAG: hypothetical protein U9N14_02320 [Pseudomonadota bacterium]|nr:hypothetical protein [Pseudomonadota bacterium]
MPGRFVLSLASLAVLFLFFGATVFAQDYWMRRWIFCDLEPGATDLEGLVFTDLTDAPTDIRVVSNTATLTGFAGPLDVILTGSGSPLMSINSGTWSTSGQVDSNDALRVSVISPDSTDTQRSLTVKVGEETATWIVTTSSAAIDTTPDAFSFTALTNQVLDSDVASAAIIVNGFDGSLTAFAGGDTSARVSVDGGPWLPDASVSSGQTLALQQHTADTSYTDTTVTVTLGSTEVSWTATTGPDTTPDAFDFVDLHGLNKGASAKYSEHVILSGFDGPVATDLEGTGVARVCVIHNSVTTCKYASDTTPDVYPGDEVFLRLYVPTDWDQMNWAEFTVGTYTARWEVWTDPDRTPDPISFTDLHQQNRATTVASEYQAVTGIDISLASSVSSSTSPSICVRRGGDVTCYAGAPTIMPDDEVLIRMNTPSDWDQMNWTELTIGTETYRWEVWTDTSHVPDPIDLGGTLHYKAKSYDYYSNVVTISGLDIPMNIYFKRATDYTYQWRITRGENNWVYISGDTSYYNNVTNGETFQVRMTTPGNWDQWGRIDMHVDDTSGGSTTDTLLASYEIHTDMSRDVTLTASEYLDPNFKAQAGESYVVGSIAIGGGDFYDGPLMSTLTDDIVGGPGAECWISINSGSWVYTTQEIMPGDFIEMMIEAPYDSGVTRTCTFSLPESTGDVLTVFTLTTE